MMENSAAKEPTTPIVRRHHALVRWSHWVGVPILLGLVLSGMSIYWASSVYQHKPDPSTGNVDFVADVGSGTRRKVGGTSWDRALAEGLDSECVRLCEAMNAVPDIETC
jgi:hypothetical protein